MHRLAAIALFCLASATAVSCLLPCNSQLRIIRPQLFRHCDCDYSEWSDWVVDTTSGVDVPTTQCPSGQALNETRSRSALGCDDITENRQICAPDAEDRLILALGLGSSGQHISPTNGPTGPPAPPATAARPAPPAPPGLPGPPGVSIHYSSVIITPITDPPPSTPDCSREQVCHHVTEDHGKRSLHSEEVPVSRKNSRPDPLLLGNDPIPFEWSEHGNRFRRQAFSDNRECHPDGTQHILFMLDTSGSIGQASFERMTSKLSELVALMCKPVKIAAMTFNHDYHVEFCFNCFENTCNGRGDVAIAMSNIQYRGGYTHTGGAARCACDVLLSESCGVDPSANCIDVVIITDGHSNDPTRDVCTEIQCLHNRFGVNTYAIGIGDGADQTELNCISDASNSMGIFNFDSFTEFENALDRIINGRLSANSSQYTCINPQEGAGSDGTCK